MNVFTLFGTISINKAKAIADLKAVETAGRTHGGKLQSILTKIGTVAKVAFAAVAAAAAGIFVAAIKKAADFELAMAKVRAITGASTEELAALNEEAKRLGLETAQTMTDIAAGMEAFGRAGFSATEIVTAMGGAVALAESQTMDLGTAVEYTANILRGMRLEAGESERVVNALAAAASSSNTTVESLAQSMKYFAPIAADLNIPLETALGLVGKLGDAGITGTMATRAMTTAFTRLAKPTDEMVEVMRELNLEFFDAEGNFIGATEMIGLLEDRFAGLTQEQRAAAISTLFGAEAMKQFSILIAEGEEGLNEYIGSITSTTKAFDQQEEMLDTLSGQWQILKGSFELLLVTIGTGMMPILKDLLEQRIIPLVNNITKWIEESGGLLGIIDKVKAKIREWADAHPLLAEAIQTVWDILKGLGSFIVNVFQGDWSDAWGDIKGVVSSAATFIKDAVVTAWNALPIPDATKTKILDVLTSIKDGAVSAFNWIKDRAVEAWSGIRESIREHGGGIIAAWDSLKAAGGELWSALSGFFGQIIGKHDEAGVAAITFADVVKGAWDILLTAVQTTLDLLANSFEFFAALLRGDFADAWTQLKEHIRIAWDGIVKILDILGLKDALQAGWEVIVDYFTVVVPESGRQIVQWMKDGLSGAWHAVIDWFKGAWDSIVNALTSWMPGFLKKWLGIGADSGKEYAAGLESARGEVTGAAGDLGDAAVEAARMSEADMEQVGRDLGEGLSLGIEQARPGVIDATLGVANDVIDIAEMTFGVKSPSTVFARIGRDLIQGLVNGMRQQFPEVAGVMSALGIEVDIGASGIEIRFRDLATSVKTLLGDMASSAVDRFFEMGAAAETAATGIEGDVGRIAASLSAEAPGIISTLGKIAMAFVPLWIGLSKEVADWVANANKWITENILGQQYGPGLRTGPDADRFFYGAMQSAATGKLFMRPSITTIAEQEPELAIPLSRLEPAFAGAGSGDITNYFYLDHVRLDSPSRVNELAEQLCGLQKARLRGQEGVRA